MDIAIHIPHWIWILLRIGGIGIVVILCGLGLMMIQFMRGMNESNL
jgi:hypothetical protein